MKSSHEKKRAKAIILLAEGKPLATVASTLKLQAKTILQWAADPDFAEEVDRHRVVLTRLERWSLMSFVEGAKATLTKGTTGEKVTVAEKDICLRLLSSVGVIIESPVDPIPPGEIKIEFGSRRQSPSGEAPAPDAPPSPPQGGAA